MLTPDHIAYYRARKTVIGVLPFRERLRFASFARLDPMVELTVASGVVVPATVSALVFYAEGCERRAVGYSGQQVGRRMLANARRARECAAVALEAAL